MEKVCVVFPPNYREFTKPDIMIGRVSGYLMQKKIIHDVCDLNIQWIQYLLSPDGIKTCRQYSEQQFAYLDQKSQLNGFEQKKYEYLFWFCSSPLKDLIAEAQYCKKVFQSEDFYVQDKLLRANHFLTNLIGISNIILSNNEVPNFFSSKFILETIGKPGFRQSYYQNIVADWGDYQKFVIVTSSETQLLDSFFILHQIKKQYPDVCCILAGHTVGILYRKFTAELTQHLDFAVAGEIENGIATLLERNAQYDNIPDLFTKMSDGNLKKTAVSQIPLDHRNISYEKIDWHLYLSPVRCISFSLTFGCCWAKCTFCNLHKSANHYHEYNVSESVDNISRLIKQCKSNLFVLTDDAMTPSLLENLSDELLQRNISVFWTLQTRFSDYLNFKLLQKMYLAGCRHIEFGLESADESVQKHMNKGITNQMAVNNLEDAHKVGIITTVNLITGYPCEEDYDKTIHFLMEHHTVIDRINNFAFYVTKGSLLEIESEKYGIRLHYCKDNDLQITYTDYHTSIPYVSRQDIEKQVYNLDKFISKDSDKIKISLCPIFEYSVFYNTTKISEILQYACPDKNDYFFLDNNSIVKLKDGLVVIELNFDPIVIKKNFLKCIAWMDRAQHIPDLPVQEKKFYILNLRDCIVYPTTESLLWIFKVLKDREMSFEKLTLNYAEQFHTTQSYAIRYLNGINTVYGFLQCRKAGNIL